MTNIYPLYSDLQKPTHSTFRSKRRSTLAYTGGKTRGVPSIVPVILHTLCQIGDDKLVSPFLGGGSVELACQAEGVKVYGYDIDPNLISFYYYLLNDPNQLANEAQKYLTAGINGNHHAFQQLKKLVPALPHSIQKAAGYFVVNRLSYGGLTFSGGNKAVNELKPSNIENIRTFSAPNLSVSLADYRQALLRHGDCTLAYLDPPYDLLKPRYYYGENGNRHRGFDHEALFKTLRDRPNWIMSYNADAPILARYEGFPKAYPCWTYSMNNSRSKEVVIFSKDLAGLAEWAQAHFTHITATNDNVRAKRDEKAAELMAASPNSTPLKCAAVLPMTELESQPSANEILPASASGSPPRSEMVVGWSAPDLSVISETKTPAPLFPRAVLGEEWGGWCSDVATGANAHFDYVAMAVITAATGLIGNSLTVRATASFHQPSVLWTCLVGKSGAGKTPAMTVISDIVDVLDRQNNHRQRLRDVTVAASVKLAAETPKGLLLFRDELSGWWTNMKRLGGEDFWLEAWNGKAYSKDRKNDEAVFVENLSISVLGGAQPSTVKDITTDGKNRGFSSRWLFAYPDPVEGYDGGGTTIDKEWATDAFGQLMDLPVGAASIPFSAEAQTIFREWWDAKRRDIADQDGLWADWMAKQGGNALRLALALEMLKWSAANEVDDLPSEIATATLTDALTLIDKWAIPMARRTLEVMYRSPSDQQAAALARFLRRQNVTTFNARLLRRGEYGQPGSLSATKAMDEACRALMEAGLIRHVGVRNHSHKGRAPTDYETNPILLGGKVGKAN